MCTAATACRWPGVTCTATGARERIWLATEQGGAWTSEEWPGVAATLSSLSSFGQDGNCELYLVDRQAGALYRIDDSERLFGAGFESRSCR